MNALLSQWDPESLLEILIISSIKLYFYISLIYQSYNDWLGIIHLSKIFYQVKCINIDVVIHRIPTFEWLFNSSKEHVNCVYQCIQ